MTNTDMINRLSNAAGVSAAQAEQALNDADWDLLDAMLLLEKRGSSKTATSSSSRGGVPPEGNGFKNKSAKYEDGHKFSEASEGAISFISKLIRNGIEISLVITKNGNYVISIPLLVVAVLMVFSVSTLFLLMLIGLFFDLNYKINDSHRVCVVIDTFFERAAELAQRIKVCFKGM